MVDCVFALRATWEGTVLDYSIKGRALFGGLKAFSTGSGGLSWEVVCASGWHVCFRSFTRSWALAAYTG
jgi:hypothetical protein